MRKLLGIAGILAVAAAIAGNALAQGYGALETRMTPNMTLPQTEWIKSETLRESSLAPILRQAVERHLRQRGYLPENFSPYAVRIEIRGLGIDATEAAIPNYANAQQRLSLWHGQAAPDQVTLSLILYHQSSGNVYWQAEASCRNVDAASIAKAMVEPMMDKFGLSAKTILGCARQP